MVARRVLVIDDEPVQLQSIRDLLETYEGVEAECAATHAEARSAIERAAAQGMKSVLVFLDGCLDGGKKSYDLIPLMAGNGLGWRIVAISSREDVLDKQREAGCTDACLKPNLLPFLKRVMAEMNFALA